jgi:hypothetical protein
MQNMSIGTFLFALVSVILLGIGISYVLKWLFPDLNNQTMSASEYTEYLWRRGGKRARGPFAILIGLGAAFLVFSLRCNLPFSLNIFGLSDRQVFIGIMVFVAVIVMIVQHISQQR